MCKDKSGIYKIEIKGKLYVGSSIRPIKYRWSDHLSQLKTGIHGNIHLQRAYNKYGKDLFIFSVLENCDPDECIDREQYWIDTLNPYYNICKLARSSYGIKRSEETKRKIGLAKIGNKNRLGQKKSESEILAISNTLKKTYASGSFIGRKGSKHTDATKAKMKLSKAQEGPRPPRIKSRIYKFDMDNNFIESYSSTREAAESINMSTRAGRDKIRKSFNSNGYYSAYNFRFKLSDQLKSGELLENLK